ncbi:MAG: HEAT repeat domain-containing protein [Desulfobulbaceae bacterium]|nr:HEAT repeat domain-containing protein [Desulfobulbaceae bacterium]
MKKKGQATVKPWCPFCGMDIGPVSDAVQRKMTEFPVGSCECGAVYVSDATGHSVGSAMIECLVYACNDNWDMAWDLIPQDDYLTARIEHYDEQTHQVVESGQLDGRWIRGILYFVRLHEDVAEIAGRFRKNQEKISEGQAASRKTGSFVEPERDPKRVKKRADKQMVKQLATADDVDALVDYCFDDRRTMKFLQRLLYEPDEAARYHYSWVIGQVCARVSSREPGQVADFLHRLFEACSDSASTSWGMIEAIGSIIAARPDIYGAFTRHLLNYMGDPSTQEQVLWALGEIAGNRPDLIRSTPFYATFHFLGHDKPEIRGLMARLMGRIKATEAVFQVVGLQNDQSEITVYEKGLPVRVTVAQLAAQAVAQIQSQEEKVNE